MNWTMKSVTFALSLALGGAAFAATVPAGVKLSDKQEMIRNNGSEVETLDPHLAESVGANNITRDLFEGLTTSDNEGRLHPGVATSWKQTDPTTWVFNLRKDAKFSNGDPITAADFVYGWQRFLDPKIASTYGTVYGIFVLNGLEVAEGKKAPSTLGIKAIDKYTLEIKTPNPIAYLPSVLANSQFAPVHKATVEKFGKEWTKPGNLIGNGAFLLKDWKVNSKIVIEKNAQYWDAKNVQLARVTYLPVEAGNAELKLYQSGDNDFVYLLPVGQYEKLKKEFPKEIQNGPILGLRYYSLNNKDPMMKDVRVRKALSMVLDRDILAQKITVDGQIPAYGVTIKGLEGADVTTYDWVKWPMAKRVEEAKKLLAEAGVKPGSKIKFTYNTDDYHKKMALFASSEWKSKLGLETELDSLEFKVLLKKRHDGDFQIARNGWLADYNDATTFLTLVQCGSSQNDNANCNKKAEELIKQGNDQQDVAKRKALLTEAAKLIMDDYPMIPLLQYTLPRLVKSYVGGYSTKNPVDRYLSKEFYIIKH